MNAAIATFHKVYNYGAKLQQCALFKTVEQMGYTAHVLDILDPTTRALYHPQWSDFLNFKGGAKRYARTAARNLVELSLKPFRRDIFRDFEAQHLREGALPGEPGAPEYAALICGSDQVWNPQVTGGDPRYFLEFNSPATLARIAYAPSFGSRDQIPESFLPELARCLQNLDVLSCREQEGCELVEVLTHRPCPRVTDPVMLLDAAEWSRMAEPPQVSLPQKFVLCFDMQQTPLLHAIGQTVARKLGASVYSLEGHLGKKGWRSPVGPAEFIWLIQNAEAVVTNSFHGTVLSILSRKPLKVIYPSGRVTRLKELLERLQLLTLLASKPEDAETPVCWNAEATIPVIEDERIRGREFLRNALAPRP